MIRPTEAARDRRTPLDRRCRKTDRRMNSNREEFHARSQESFAKVLEEVVRP